MFVVCSGGCECVRVCAHTWILYTKTHMMHICGSPRTYSSSSATQHPPIGT